MKKKLIRIFHPYYIFSMIFLLISSTLYYGLMLTVISYYVPVELGESYNLTILDHAGSQISSTIFEKEGRYIGLKEIPNHTQQAFIAVEDRNFYNHKGYNFTRILQAAFINVSSKSIEQGGSTITQQLARTLYLNNDKSYGRKARELMIAMSLESKYSKAQILEAYLNTIYLGHGLYGINQAAKYYFNVEAYQLNLAQSAMLAGLCSSPSTYSPEVSEELAKQVQQKALLRMYEQGYINSKEYYEALDLDLKYYLKQPSSSNNAGSYYIDAVKKELSELKLLSKSNLIKGMVVETNANIEISAKIQEITEKYTYGPNTQIGIVLMNSYSGEVISLLGGTNYEKTQFNRATDARRPIGSTIKPLIYYLALESGMTPASEFYSEKTSYLVKNYGQFNIYNAGERYAERNINMIEAIGVSDNCYAAKTTLLVGSQNVAEAVSFFSETKIEAAPTLAFGTAEMTPIELASLYNTFASEGRYYRPRLIKRVLDSKGRVIYKSNYAGQEIMNINSVRLLSQMLTSPFDLNLASESYTSPTLVNYRPKTAWAAKTGSTAASSWVAAYNPYYTIVVYVGTDNNTELEEVTLSRRLFVQIADEISKNSNGAWYPPTSRQIAMRVNPVTLIPSSSGSIYYFPR